MMNLTNIILSNRKQAQKNMCSVILSHTVQKPLDRSLRCQQPPLGESSNGGGLQGLSAGASAILFLTLSAGNISVSLCENTLS